MTASKDTHPTGGRTTTDRGGDPHDTAAAGGGFVAPSRPPEAFVDNDRGLLAHTNPVARILALIVLTTPLLLSIDLVSAATACALMIVLAVLCRTNPKMLLLRSVPILIVVPFSGISMLFYGRPEGVHYFDFGWIHVTSNSVELAIAIMVRILAVALPAIILIVGIDPTELGDGLAQILKLPSRFVVGAMASFRLVSLFIRDWHALSRARRSRGLADSGKVSHFISLVFGLLVLALRRGGKLATAMEARGFGSPIRRTWGRVATLTIHDVVLIVVCALFAAAALGLAVVTGSFRFLGT